MIKNIERLENEISGKQAELAGLWIDFVKQKKEVLLHGNCISLQGGFCEPMTKMYYKDNDVILVDAFGNEESLAGNMDADTLKDLKFAVFGC